MMQEMKIPGFAINTKRNDLSVWVFPSDLHTCYADCGACRETIYMRPSRFCPNCGALMLNIEAANVCYTETLESLKGNGGK